MVSQILQFTRLISEIKYISANRFFSTIAVSEMNNLILIQSLNVCFFVLVERLREYLQAAGVPALQCFNLDNEKRMKLELIFCQMQNVFILYFRKKHFV